MGPDSAGPASDKKCRDDFQGMGWNRFTSSPFDENRYSFKSVTCDTSVNKRAVTVVTAPRQVNTNSVHELTSTASGSGGVQTLKEQNAGRVRFRLSYYSVRLSRGIDRGTQPELRSCLNRYEKEYLL